MKKSSTWFKRKDGWIGEALDLPARSLLALKLQRRQAASAKAGRNLWKLNHCAVSSLKPQLSEKLVPPPTVGEDSGGGDEGP